MEELFHVYSDGSLSVDLFENETEMDAALNRIAVVSFITHVRVLGFDIQDTHVHFLLRGGWSDIINFKFEYQKRTRNHISRNRKNMSQDKFKLDVLPISDGIYARRAAAYVICQATKDGKKVMPYDYKWSSAALYFRTSFIDALWTVDINGHPKKVIEMKDLSMNFHKYNLYARNRLPDAWKVCDGLILPSSYVDIAGFEDLFTTHNTFRVFCGGPSSKDSEILNTMASHSGISYEENEARLLAKSSSKETFGISDIRKLDSNQRLELARILRNKHRIGIPQIARRVHLPENEVRKYLK